MENLWFSDMFILPFVGLSICSIFQILVNQSIQEGLSLKEDGQLPFTANGSHAIR